MKKSNKQEVETTLVDTTLVDTLKERYAYIYENNITNVFATLSAKAQKMLNNEIKAGNGNVYVHIRRTFCGDVQYWMIPLQVQLDGSTAKMFDYLIYQFTSKVHKNATLETIIKNREMEIDIKDISEKFGMTMHGARKTTLQTINSLSNIKIDRLDIPGERDKYVKNGKVPIKWSFPIVSAIGVYAADKQIKNSKMKITLHERLTDLLLEANLMWYPKNLLKINTHYYPYAYMFGRKMALNTRQNAKKKNSNYLSVKLLMEMAYLSELYEKLKEKGDIGRRIIAPFLHNIKVLVDTDVLEEWHIEDKFGTTILFPECLSYAELNECKVYYKLKDYPKRLVA